MKTIALFISCLMLSACGNWSNEDIEFLYAMPRKEDLVSKLPTGTTKAPLVGEGTRRDALETPVLGAPSALFKDTRNGSNGFNQILDGMIGILDFIQKVPPTSRTADSRIWGPWNDDKNPGFEVRVTIKKVSELEFNYAFSARPKGGEFFDIVNGVFKPTAAAFMSTERVRKGSGKLVIDTVAASRLPSAKGLEMLQQIEMAYVTDMFPVTVLMKFTARTGQVLQTLDYGYQENEDKSGGIGFRAVGTDPNALKWNTGAAWLASGAGYAAFNVEEGNYKGAMQFECWDTSFKTVYAIQTWPGGINIGDSKGCVSVDNHPKP